jgi:hypothetical protein
MRKVFYEKLSKKKWENSTKKAEKIIIKKTLKQKNEPFKKIIKSLVSNCASYKR